MASVYGKKNFFGILKRHRKPEPLAQYTQLSPKARLILELLRERARGNEVQISQSELAKLTGWHRNTIAAYLREARAVGVLTWQRRPNRSNIYRLLVAQTDVHPASQGHSRPPPLYEPTESRQMPPRGMVEEIGSLDEALPGREEELAEVERLAAKGANTLILGFDGMGKTSLLRHLSQDGLAAPCDVKIHLATPAPAKEFFLNLAEELQALGELETEEDLERLKLRALFRLVRDSLAKSRKRYLLFIDDLDQITPSQKPMVRELLELRNVQVIATAKTERPRYASLWHHFFKVELKRLPKEVSDQIVERFLEEKSIPVTDKGWGRKDGRELLKERLYRRSRGNPRELWTLLRKIEVHGFVDRKFLEEELGAPQEHEYIDMTWIVIMTAAIIMAARYLGLGLHDRELYVLAGISYAAMILIRWLSYRWRR